jgi:hypothetical protein
MLYYSVLYVLIGLIQLFGPRIHVDKIDSVLYGEQGKVRDLSCHTTFS